MELEKKEGAHMRSYQALVKVLEESVRRIRVGVERGRRGRRKRGERRRIVVKDWGVD